MTVTSEVHTLESGLTVTVTVKQSNLPVRLHRGLERSDQDLVSRTPINCPCVSVSVSQWVTHFSFV